MTAPVVHVQFIDVFGGVKNRYRPSVEPTVEPGESTLMTRERYRVSVDGERWVVVPTTGIWTYFELRVLIASETDE